MTQRNARPSVNRKNYKVALWRHSRKPFYVDPALKPSCKKTSSQLFNKLARHSQARWTNSTLTSSDPILIRKSTPVKVLTNLRVIGRYVRQTLNWLLSFCPASGICRPFYLSLMLNIAAAKTPLCPGLVVRCRKSQLFGENKQGADVREGRRVGGGFCKSDVGGSNLASSSRWHFTSAFENACIESAFFSSDLLCFAQQPRQEVRFAGRLVYNGGGNQGKKILAG